MIFSDLYINGKWVEGAGRHPVYDPSDGSVIAEIAIAGDKEVDAAMNAAAAAFPTFAQTPSRQRGEMLRRAFDFLLILYIQNEMKTTYINK